MTTAINRNRQAMRIGLFVVVGLLLVMAAVLVAAGGRLFARKNHVVMNFSGSVYGLQVGAPVVFRGVSLGTVTAIGLAYDSARDRFTIPVTADLDSDAVGQLQADGRLAPATLPLQALLAKGLSAQLGMQSLLTGQLYVDLDLRPNRPLATSPHDPGLVEIPTAATAIQNLKAQLDGMDFRRVLDDLTAIAAAVKQLTTGPALPATLDELRGLAVNLRGLSARLDRQVDPLAQSAQRSLADARQLMGQLQASVQGSSARLNDTLGRVGHTADQASALLAPDSPLLLQLQRSADELARTATTLRAQAADDGPLAQNLDRTLQDVSRAARAVRQLAELLEQQPQSLLRGRAAPAPARAEPP